MAKVEPDTRISTCEFLKPNPDGTIPACNTAVALRKVMADEQAEGVFSLIDLMRLVCEGTSQADRLKRCSAYCDLSAHGRSTSYCK